MFENYLATDEDFRAIEEGLRTVWKKELDFIFKNRNLIEDVVVISYDAKFLYLWTRIKLPRLKTFTSNLSNYHTYKIPHKIKIKDEWQTGWRAGLSIKQFNKLLSTRPQKSNFEIPKISGGLLTPFIELQKKKKVKNNPYITRESFPATLVHEFGHIYWNQHKLWWYSNKKENLRYLKMAKQLYEQEEEIPKIPLYFPVNAGIGEIFAFCTEYWVSSVFWPKHQHNLDIFAQERLRRLTTKERKKDLEREDSVLEPNKNPHDFAFVFSKIILARYPKTWPQKLLKKFIL